MPHCLKCLLPLLFASVAWAADAPAITSVVNGASFQAGFTQGSWVTINGTNLAGATRIWTSDDFKGANLPTTLDQVSVTINGKAAYIYYVSPTQLNILAPADTSSGSVPVQVTYAGTASNIVNATEAAFAPALFCFSPLSGKYVAAVRSDGQYLGPTSLYSGLTVPAGSGDTILLFGTGFGPTSPTTDFSQTFSNAPVTANSVTATIGGVTATVQYAGLVAPGEYQFNLVVPTLPAGDHVVVLKVNGLSTQANAYLTVGGSASSSTATSTTLTSSSASPAYGDSIALTAAVSPAAATGTVTFYDGSTSLGTAALNSGAAILTTTALAVGTHRVTAVYGGTGNYAGSTSNAVTITVIAAGGASKTVGSGETWVVSSTTTLGKLIIASGATVKAPTGYSLSMTVNGVETGQALTSTSGVDSTLAAGTYSGNVVLTVATSNPVSYSVGNSGGLTFPVRQALYLDSSGVVSAKSVPAAATYSQSGFTLSDLNVASTGEVFDAVYVAGGTYLLTNPVIDLKGNGRSDFVGYGSAVVASGTSTKLVLDGAKITTQGVVRNAVVATGGSSVIVKNSTIYTGNGTLPGDYTQTVNTEQMRSAPWMLGLNGTDNIRATNLLGSNTKATYINSTITSEGWGVLSTDSGSNCTLAAINSNVAISGGTGYGSYIIGNATEYFLGTQFDVATYAAINTGGSVRYADSTTAAVAQLNTNLGLGLTSTELAALPQKSTIINSKRFGVMWHSSSGSVEVTGGTRFNTREAVFLVKSANSVSITVDGSGGAALTPSNGVLLQVMDDDDPGPVGSGALNTGTYTEPTTTPSRVSSFDVTSTSNAASATFSNIALVGNFYNSSGWTLMSGSSGGKQNMALTFTNSTITGVITSSEAHHLSSTITAAQYAQLGTVTNTPRAAINNGAIVVLNAGSKWIVTGTSYLTRLTVAGTASVVSPTGGAVTMTVDGTTTTIVPGTTYTGAIKLTI